MLKTLFFAATAFILSAPVAFAQTGDITGSTIPEYLRSITEFILVILVPLVFAVAFVAFIYGIFLYFIAGGADEEKRSQGKQLAIWGVVGFFVMVSVWGLVNVLRGTFNLTETVPNLPTFDVSQPSSSN